MPMADFPGIGDKILTSALATAYAIFLLNAVTLSTFTAGPSSTSYLVTVGPRENPVTVASISNCEKTLVRESTTPSLILLLVFGTGPGFKLEAGGSL